MNNKKNHRIDIIISGAGIAGLALAGILGTQGIHIALCEPNPPKSVNDTSASGRTIALMHSSLNVLNAAGLNDFLDLFGTPMKIMRIIDDSVAGQENLESEFESRDIGLPYFGLNIPNNLLRATLFEKILNLPSVEFYNSAIKDYTTDGIVRSELEDGTVITAPLIIGADGRNSRIRKISGIKTWEKKYDQSAITCIINHSKSHNNTSTEFHRSGGPFALVPMKGNQSSVVWVEKSTQTDELLKLQKQDFEQQLQLQTHDILGAINLETPPECWPLCSIKAKSLTAERMALIAEAAHVMSPITAQGLNLSLRDVASLAEVIIDAMRLGLDQGSNSVLRKYQNRRNIDISTRVFGVDTMNQIVSTKNPSIKFLRRNGLKLIERIHPLKRFAMNHGLAPALDQDRILKGIKI